MEFLREVLQSSANGLWFGKMVCGGARAVCSHMPWNVLSAGNCRNGRLRTLTH